MANQSKNKFTMKTKYGVAVAPVVVLAGAFLAWSYIRRRALKQNKDSSSDKSDSDRSILSGRDKKVGGSAHGKGGGRREKPWRSLSRSVSMGAIHGGKVAMQRLLDFHCYQADASTLKDVETEFKGLLVKEQPDFESLQRAIVKMEVKGKEAEGVQILKEALEKARKDGKGHDAYEIEMVLVEMLIYKGDLEEASKCKCLEDELITDVRRPLYKTIINYLQGEPENKVLKLFQELREMQSRFQWSSNLEEGEIHRVISNFDEFKKVVELLKKDIEEDKKNTSTRKS